jgi:competence protein ComEA
MAVVFFLMFLAAQDPPPLPEGPARALVEEVCSRCHEPAAAISGKQFTATQWELKVIEMLQEEADVTDEERAQILAYLSAHFKPSKINVNRANADDLVPMLEISKKEAEAIVQFRKQNGAFKSIDDLKKVPGIDAARLDAGKDRLEF